MLGPDLHRFVYSYSSCFQSEKQTHAKAETYAKLIEIVTINASCIDYKL